MNEPNAQPQISHTRAKKKLNTAKEPLKRCKYNRDEGYILPTNLFYNKMRSTS